MYNMKSKILLYISIWEKRGYEDGIPDEGDCILEFYNKIPSYKKICLAIMKNDFSLSSLGFDRIPCESYKALKNIEINQRKGNLYKQLELFK